MGAVAIRLDDIHGRTPVDLLHCLAGELWRGKPVTYAAIPYAAPLCLGPTATTAERPGPRSTRRDGPIVELLRAVRREGSDIALHGLTHADHKSAAGPAVPELVAIRPRHATALVSTLETWRGEFGTRVLVPPHNAIDLDLAQSLVEHGYVISRSITDAEVAELGLDTTPEGRAAAKLVPPEGRPASRSQYFQTISVSQRYVDTSKRTPEDTAKILLRAAGEAGNATLTLHWWDFVLRAEKGYVWKYVADLLLYLSQRTQFVPISSLDAG
jgi:hypothetical protein